MVFFRSGSIITDFKIVVNKSSKNEAQSNITKIIHDLLSRRVNVTYSGQDYVVDEVTVTNSMGQNTSKHICVNEYIKFKFKLFFKNWFIVSIWNIKLLLQNVPTIHRIDISIYLCSLRVVSSIARNFHVFFLNTCKGSRKVFRGKTTLLMKASRSSTEKIET